MLEKELEAKFRAKVKAEGAMVLKLISPGNAGVPDRLVLAPNGKAYFVELKKPGGKLRPLQRYMIKQIREMGFSVYVIDSEKDIEQFIREVMSDEK